MACITRTHPPTFSRVSTMNCQLRSASIVWFHHLFNNIRRHSSFPPLPWLAWMVLASLWPINSTANPYQLPVLSGDCLVHFIMLITCSLRSSSSGVTVRRSHGVEYSYSSLDHVYVLRMSLTHKTFTDYSFQHFSKSLPNYSYLILKSIAIIPILFFHCIISSAW